MRVRAHHRVAGHAGLATARGHLTGRLAGQRLLVEAALAGDHEAGVAHQLVEAERVEHVGRAGHEARAPVRPETARQPARGPGHRGAARIARGGIRELGQAALEPLHHARVGALLGAEHPRRALERRAHVAEHLELRLHAGLVERRQRAGAAVGGGAAAHGHEHLARARLHGGHDQLAGAVGAGRPRVPLLLGDALEPAGLGRLHHGAAVGQQGEARLQRTPERIAHAGGSQLATQRRPRARPWCPRRRRRSAARLPPSRPCASRRRSPAPRRRRRWCP